MPIIGSSSSEFHPLMAQISFSVGDSLSYATGVFGFKSVDDCKTTMFRSYTEVSTEDPR